MGLLRNHTSHCSVVVKAIDHKNAAKRAENSDSTVATYKQMRGFTAAYTMQPYIQQIRGYRLRKSMAQIRCSSHKLRVETGRHTSEARHERTCRLCNSATAIEDEQHILLHCPQLDDLRNAHSHLFQTPGQTLRDLFDDHPPMLLLCVQHCLCTKHELSVPCRSLWPPDFKSILSHAPSGALQKKWHEAQRAVTA